MPHAPLRIAAVLLVFAGCAEAARPEPSAPSGAPVASAAAVGVAPSPVGPPEIAEPEGIGAKRHVAPAPPTGNGVWVVDPASARVTATLGVNEPLTMEFRGAVAGAIDGASGKGVFTVDLTTLESTDSAHRADRARDAAIVEGFFAARPSPKPEVLAVWRGLSGKLATGVSRATLVVDKVPIGVGMVLSPPAKVNPEYVESSTVTARLLLWESVETPIDVPLEIGRRDDVLEVKSGAPAKIHLARTTGSAIRAKLVDAMTAAGFTKSGGLGNDVSIVVRLKLKLAAS